MFSRVLIALCLLLIQDAESHYNAGIALQKKGDLASAKTELRRAIEAIPEAEYHRLSYYRRWMRSITDNLLRSGVITESELRAALEAA